MVPAEQSAVWSKSWFLFMGNDTCPVLKCRRELKEEDFSASKPPIRSMKSRPGIKWRLALDCPSVDHPLFPVFPQSRVPTVCQISVFFGLRLNRSAGPPRFPSRPIASADTKSKADSPQLISAFFLIASGTDAGYPRKKLHDLGCGLSDAVRVWDEGLSSNVPRARKTQVFVVIYSLELL